MTRIAALMKEQGRKPTWLAEKIGVRREQVYKWIRGEAIPFDSNKKLIAETLGVTIGWLFFDENVPKTRHS